MFDEYFNYPNWQEHEFRAFQELVARCHIEYEYLGYARFQVSVKINAISKAPPAAREHSDLTALENLSAQ